MDSYTKCEAVVRNLKECHQYLHQDENKRQFYACTAKYIPDYVKHCGIKEPLLLSAISPLNINLNLNH